MQCQIFSSTHIRQNYNIITVMVTNIGCEQYIIYDIYVNKHYFPIKTARKHSQRAKYFVLFDI